LIADVLARQQVKVTFFAANEHTKTGDGSLGTHWAPWWKARAAEGMSSLRTPGIMSIGVATCQGRRLDFASAHRPGPTRGATSSGRRRSTAKRSTERLNALYEVTGKKPLPLFRAPGGKTSPALLQAAKACGYEHVAWSPAGFLGDELPSEKASNEALLKKALRDVRSGDILVAHLGIWSRKDPWAPAVLEPLIVGLKEKGFCFFDLARSPSLSRLDCKGALTMDWIEEAFSFVQQWLFETLMQPAMFALGLGNFLEDGYAAAAGCSWGLIQIAVLVAVIGPLQRWRPGGACKRPRHHPHRHSLHRSFTGWAFSGWACSSWSIRCSTGCSACCELRASATFHVDQFLPASPTRRW
jgi:peptidoglycan/xylan/chitin deacetylase (PgdA/CDA1 family)